MAEGGQGPDEGAGAGTGSGGTMQVWEVDETKEEKEEEGEEAEEDQGKELSDDRRGGAGVSAETEEDAAMSDCTLVDESL